MSRKISGAGTGRGVVTDQSLIGGIDRLMTVTVIVCTLDRCEDLGKTLRGLAASILPDMVEWEVLVVDNNSRDRTRDVVESVSRQYPGRFRYLFEAERGKSYALNSAIAAAKGDVLAFVDDDVRVESTWLWNLTQALRSPEWAGAGGRVVLEWNCAPPGWLPEGGTNPLGILAAFDLGPQSGELFEPPFGVNMAFRRALFGKYGGFRTDLGPSPNRRIPRPGEDTEFGRRVLAAGERLRYESGAIVYHPVPAARIQKSYFLAWWFDKGRAEMREFGMPPDATLCVMGIPLRLLRNLIVWTARWMIGVEPRWRFRCKLNVWFKCGEIIECRRFATKQNLAFLCLSLLFTSAMSVKYV
jgi:glucosyl-dolichyl phosphate glucuronosyltransferase